MGNKLDDAPFHSQSIGSISPNVPSVYPTLCFTTFIDKEFNNIKFMNVPFLFWFCWINYNHSVYEKVIPIEVKNKERINKRDLKGLLKFCSIVKLNEGFVVSRGGDERSIEADGVRIEIMPISRFLSLQRE